LGQNDTVLVDFGNFISPAPWTNINNQTNGQVNPLVNEKGLTTNYRIEVFDAFNGINGSGSQAPDPSLGIPGSASGDSFYGNMQPFGGQTQSTGGVRFDGLLPGKQYTVELFASRTASDNRETKYTITGQTTDSLFLNVASNTMMTVQLSIYPAADSSIVIEATAGPNNNNTYGFYYLGVVKLIYASEPPSGPVTLDLVTPNGGEYWQVGKAATIQWQSENVGLVDIEYSQDNGVNWQHIDNVFAAQQSYSWLVPNTPSAQCLIRLTAGTHSKSSAATCDITTDTSICRIVVLGSSTAAGAGPSSPDSTWVNRYFNAIGIPDTRIEIINLARGGYTTYHILPTGSTIPPVFNVDTTRNVTKALSYNPTAIIINMPSNDAANNIGVAQQMVNFDLIYTTAQNEGVATWICTTQPRNDLGPTQVQVQSETKDSILSVYGTQAIDFWNGLADPNNLLLPAYNSGDNVHLNDEGHRILFERVFAKQIDDQTCMPITVSTEEVLATLVARIYPNPSNGPLHIELDAPVSGELVLECFDIYGRLVTQKREWINAGQQVIGLEVPGSVSGLIWLRVRLADLSYGGAVFLE